MILNFRLRGIVSVSTHAQAKGGGSPSPFRSARNTVRNLDRSSNRQAATFVARACAKMRAPFAKRLKFCENAYMYIHAGAHKRRKAAPGNGTLHKYANIWSSRFSKDTYQFSQKLVMQPI